MVWGNVLSLKCTLGLVACVHLACAKVFKLQKVFLYSKVFKLEKVFLKFLCGSFGIDLFVSSDTYKGKTVYTWISPDPA